MTETLHHLIENLKRYDKIIVTGPQRAGTTIAMEIIAHELSYEGLREEVIDVDNLSLLAGVLRCERFVLQAPGLCPVVHLLRDKDIAVVIVKRDVSEIIKSQERINWGINEIHERKKYFISALEPISEIKYRNWEMFQKEFLKERWFELQYDSMRTHPLFIEQRENFHSRQTTIE